MGLEDFVPSEWMDSWPKSAEISEKFKESIKKASAWIKRVQKDEKKAKKFDSLLAWFLVEIVKNNKYDFIHEEIFNLINIWFWSNFVLWMISIIYEPISLKIRELSNKNNIEFYYKIYEEKVFFSESLLDEKLKNRINFWIEDIFDVISIEYSSIQLKKLLELLEWENFFHIKKFWISIFKFFFINLNIEISNNQANLYLDFILKELIKKIKTIKIEEI